MTALARVEEKLRRMGVALQSPILVRELRALLRGRKFFVSHMLLLTVLAGVLLIAATTSAAQGQSDPADVGRALYYAFALGLSVVVIFLVPAFSCTSVTTEREGKTLDLLLTTTIRPWEIVWGKLLSALVVILLFMASALPLITVCFLFGGVSPWDLAILYLGVLFSTLVVSSVSLAVSAHCKESKTAVVISYVLTLVVAVVEGALFAAVFATMSGGRATILSAMLSGFKWQEQLLIVLAPQFVGISIFAINFAAAANRLKPTTANRSTNLRVIWAVFLLGCLVLYMITVNVEQGVGNLGRSDWDELLPVSMSIAAPLVWLGALYFGGEEAIQPPRVVEDASRLRRLLWPLRIFMPGPLTAVPYTAFVAAVALGGLTLFGYLGASAAGRASDAEMLVHAAVPLALFILTSAGVAALFSSFGLNHRGAGLAAFGTTAVLAFGPLIHLLCQEAITSGTRLAGSSLWTLHYLSPVVAAIGAWHGGGDAFRYVLPPGGGKVPLWGVATLAYAALAVATWALAAVRVRRMRERWRQTLAAAAGSGPAAGEG